MRFGKRREFTVMDRASWYGDMMELRVQGYEILDTDPNFPKLFVYASPQFHHLGELKGQPTGEQDTKHWNVAEFYTAMKIPTHQLHNSDCWKTRKGAAYWATHVLHGLDTEQIESLRNLKANDGKLIYNGEVTDNYPILNKE